MATLSPGPANPPRAPPPLPTRRSTRRSTLTIRRRSEKPKSPLPTPPSDPSTSSPAPPPIPSRASTANVAVTTSDSSPVKTVMAADPVADPTPAKPVRQIPTDPVLEAQNKHLLAAIVALTNGDWKKNRNDDSRNWKRDAEGYAIPPDLERLANDHRGGTIDILEPSGIFFPLTKTLELETLFPSKSKIARGLETAARVGDMPFQVPARGPDAPASAQRLRRLYLGPIQALKDEAVILAKRSVTRVHQANRIRRNPILNELVVTERTYVRSLKLFLHSYLPEIPTQRGACPVSLRDSIQKNVEAIIRVNEPFLERLEEIVRGTGAAAGDNAKGAQAPAEDSEGDAVSHYINVVRPRKVSELFVEHTASFRATYVTFANFYTEAIREWRKVVAAKEILHRFTETKQFAMQKKGHRATTFGSFLIMPIQRVPRYKLLLKDLLKRSDGEPYVESLLRAIAEVEKTAMFVNRKRKEDDHSTRTTDLARRFKSLRSLVANRILMRFSPSVRINQARGSDSPKDEIYVFNGLLVMVVRKKAVKILTDNPDVRCNLSREDEFLFTVETQRQSFVVRCDTIRATLEFVKTICAQLVHVVQVSSYNQHYQRELYFGWLEKEGGGRWNRSLRRRWHVITGDLKIKYYNREGGKMKGSYSLVGVKFGQTRGKNYESGFYVRTTKRMYCMKADSDTEREAWLGVLETVVGIPRVDE